MKNFLLFISGLFLTLQLPAQVFNARPQGTQKPVLHGNQWMAITGKPLAATAGAIDFKKEAMPWNYFDLRDGRCYVYNVGCFKLGRRNAKH